MPGLAGMYIDLFPSLPKAIFILVSREVETRYLGDLQVRFSISGLVFV